MKHWRFYALTKSITSGTVTWHAFCRSNGDDETEIFCLLLPYRVIFLHERLLSNLLRRNYHQSHRGSLEDLEPFKNDLYRVTPTLNATG